MMRQSLKTGRPLTRAEWVALAGTLAVLLTVGRDAGGTTYRRPLARAEWAFPTTLPGSPYGISLSAMGTRKPL